MDPNSFAINWEQTGEVLTAIVVVAFIVERALALVFESAWYIKVLADKNVKELITFGVCIVICLYWKIDALSVILHGDRINPLGMIISAGVIAGGSKASLKLFRDIMGIENNQAKVDREERYARASAVARQKENSLVPNA